MYNNASVLCIKGLKFSEKSFAMCGPRLTAVNEVRKYIFYILSNIFILLRYTVCDVKLPYLGKCPYSGFLQGFIQHLIPGLPHPGNFPYCVKTSIQRRKQRP